MTQPTWMAAAWAELGLTETPGAASNPRVLALFRDAGHPEITSDATAWCAAYTGAVLVRAGIGSSGSLLARSYLAWGKPLDSPSLGAVAVFSRGTDPALGHVGFWIGETEGQVLVLGGNQSNAVSVAAIDRARLLGLRWPDAAIDGSAPAVDLLFARCLAHVLAMEGGYSDDPYDPGGPTNQGVTLAVFARHLGETIDDANRAILVQRLRRIDAATVRAIYRTRYWQPSQAAAMPPPVALMHFDAAVNHGVVGASRLLQTVVGVEVDGEIGPITLAAVRRSDSRQLVAAYAEARRQRYRALPHFWRFGNGWLARVVATEQLAASPAFSPPIDATKGTTPMTDAATPDSPANAQTDAQSTKWWGESLTVWGALVTAVSTVLPILAPVIGLDLTPDIVRKLGDQTLVAVQAIGGVVGTLMTILGRARASTPLSRRSMTIQL